MKTLKKVKGFTLVELMVTIAIMGIMAAIALPSLGGFVSRTRLQNRAEQVANLMRYARGEAVRMNAQVVVCGETIRTDGRPSGQECQANAFDSAGKAQGGLKAFSDVNRNGKVDANLDTTLRTITINSNDDARVALTLEYCDIAGQNCAAPATDADKRLLYYPDGKFGVPGQATASKSVQIKVHDTKDTSSQYDRYVVVTATGNVKVCTKQDNVIPCAGIN